MSINSISMPGGKSEREMPLEGGGDFLRILLGTRRKLNLADGRGRQHRLGPFALVAAGQAVDVARRPGPAALQRRKPSSPPVARTPICF